MLVCRKLTREEKRSCGELYMKYRRFMYSVAVEHASCGMLAEDIVQNASYTLAMYSERIRNLDEPARLTYIRLLVQSSAADHYRQVDRDEKLQFQMEAVGSCCARSAEADYMDYANHELLNKVLESLEERDRVLLTGKFYLRLSDEELAEMVGCKPDSVRMLVKRAKQKAQKKLIKEGFSHDEI